MDRKQYFRLSMPCDKISLHNLFVDGDLFTPLTTSFTLTRLVCHFYVFDQDIRLKNTLNHTVICGVFFPLNSLLVHRYARS
jgi:hypothetical protein